MTTAVAELPRDCSELTPCELHNRVVMIRKLKDGDSHFCEDCHEQAVYKVHEINSVPFSPSPPWYWCGKCDIGG